MTKPKSTQATKNLPTINTADAWPKTPAPVCNSTATGAYTAPELRPFEGRPGSLDFLGCPSRCGSRLAYRDGAS